MSDELHNDEVPHLQPYAEEVLCANWNPLVLLLAEPPARAQRSQPDSSEVEGFMARIYVCQHA